MNALSDERYIFMDTINGIFAEAAVYAETVEDYAQAQIKMILDNEI